MAGEHFLYYAQLPAHLFIIYKITMNTIKNTVATRVKQLQKWMEEERLDAFIVPTIDPHNLSLIHI